MHFPLTFFRKVLLGDLSERQANNKEEEDKNEEGEREGANGSFLMGGWKGDGSQLEL